MTPNSLLEITRENVNLTKKIADFKSENYCVHIQIDVYLFTDAKEPMRFNKSSKAQLDRGSRVVLRRRLIDLI